MAGRGLAFIFLKRFYKNGIGNCGVFPREQSKVVIRLPSIMQISSSTNENYLSCLLDNALVEKYLGLIERDNSYLSRTDSPETLNRLFQDKKELEKEFISLETMNAEGDVELKKLLDEEKETLIEKLHQIKLKILDSLLTDEDESSNEECDTEMKIIPAIGGDEAKLFAEELYAMYMNYVAYKQWDCLYAEIKNSKADFSKGGKILISGESAFSFLKTEGGVHRVQRVPATEKSGRTHTSTCSVVVYKKKTCDDIQIKPTDLVYELIRSSGPGGQNVNKVETCVRIKHLPTGITVECQESRYQYMNKKYALQKLKNILIDQQLTKITSEEKTTKKEQAGTNDYSDKIRTYHYTQNRITDHRLNYTVHNIQGFLSGGKELDQMISKLQEFSHKEKLLRFITNELKFADSKNSDKQRT